jgi:hypothetical protein
MQEGLPAALLLVAVIAALLLFFGGIQLVRQGRRQKGALMIAASLVLLANVLIWIWPLAVT